MLQTFVFLYSTRTTALFGGSFSRTSSSLSALGNIFHLFFPCPQIVGVWFCEQGELQQMDAMLGRIFEMHPSFEASRSGRVGTGASSSGAGVAAGAPRQQVGVGLYLCSL